MRTNNWKRLVLTLSTAAILLQAPACTDIATILTGVSSAVTASGVLFIITRILE